MVILTLNVRKEYSSVSILEYNRILYSKKCFFSRKEKTLNLMLEEIKHIVRTSVITIKYVVSCIEYMTSAEKRILMSTINIIKLVLKTKIILISSYDIISYFCSKNNELISSTIISYKQFLYFLHINSRFICYFIAKRKEFLVKKRISIKK